MKQSTLYNQRIDPHPSRCFLCQPEVQGEPLPRGENKKAQENAFYKSVYKTSLRYLSSHLPSYLQHIPLKLVCYKILSLGE